MRKLFVVLGVVLLAGLPALAQDYPKAEVYGGYQFLSVGNGGRINAPIGFDFNVAGNVNKTFGIVGDFGANFKSGFKLYSYTGGVRFNGRGEKVTGFGQFLAGGATLSNGGSVSGLALAFGGGADVNINSKWAIRVVQADWVLARFSGVWTTSTFRVGAGVVYKVGGGS